MKKILKLYEEEDEYVGVCYQYVSDELGKRFSVYNLNECPEDAIIDRDLFSADDYLNAVKYGIALAQQGYDDAEYEMEDE